MKKQIEFFYKNPIALESTEIEFVDLDKTATQNHKNLGHLKIIGGDFLLFERQFIETGAFNPLSSLNANNDGIALEINDKALIVVEIKTTIGFQTYQKILQQLCASYLKTLLKLSFISSPQKIEIQFFIIGNWHEKDIEGETIALDEGKTAQDNLMYISFWKLKKEGVFIFPKLPHIPDLVENLAEEYKKEQVKVWYYPPNSTHNFSTNA